MRIGRNSISDKEKSKFRRTKGLELATFEAEAKRKEKNRVGRSKIQWVPLGEDRHCVLFAKRRP